METFAHTFEHASAMPAPTWNFLRMNDTTIEIPNHLTIKPHVNASIPPQAHGSAEAFDKALASNEPRVIVLHIHRSFVEPMTKGGARINEFVDFK